MSPGHSISAPAHLLVFLVYDRDSAGECSYFLQTIISMSSLLQFSIIAEHLVYLSIFVSTLNSLCNRVVLSTRPCSDVVFLDSLCNTHAFKSSMSVSPTYLLCQLGSGSCKPSFYRCNSSPFPRWSILFREGGHHPGYKCRKFKTSSFQNQIVKFHPFYCYVHARYLLGSKVCHPSFSSASS